MHALPSNRHSLESYLVSLRPKSPIRGGNPGTFLLGEHHLLGVMFKGGRYGVFDHAGLHVHEYFFGYILYVLRMPIFSSLELS